MKNIPQLLLCLMGTVSLYAQHDTLPPSWPDDHPDQMEEVFQQSDSEQVAHFGDLAQHLNDIRRKPLNINKAEEQDLQELRLLSDAQITALLQHRQYTGHFISVLELQTVNGFSTELIRSLLPYITVSGDLDDYQVSLRDMLRQGSNELYLRGSTILEQEEGYRPAATQEDKRYLGNGHQYYLRYRHAYGNRLSLGLTAEKDRGEEFFRGSNPTGFDFYSAHLALRNYTKQVKAIILGDYTVSMGQGLIMLSGFSFGKTISGIGSKRSGQNLRPYTSAAESGFMRGAAAQIALTEQWRLTAFISGLRQDGKLLDADTTAQHGFGPAFQTIGSININGYHRTPQEVADRRLILQQSTGATVQWKTRQHHVALNTVYSRLDNPMPFREKPEALFDFAGKAWFNTSVDYGLLFRHIQLFGETALSGNLALAQLHGIILPVDKNAALTVVYRHYDRDFHSFAGGALSESSGVRNEEGLYFGLEIRPGKMWTINAYADFWQHPWLKYGADAPSIGNEYRGRITYSIRRNLSLYLEIRQKNREANFRNNASAVDYLTMTQLRHLRIHLAKTINKGLEIRTRLDLGDYDEGTEMPVLSGVSLYQDIIFKPVGMPFSLTTRFAVFDTDGFAVRFYHYENNMLFVASNQAYYQRGTRFYLNLRYRPHPQLTLEGRIAQTYWLNQQTIGSGLEQIDGPSRTQLALQLRYQF